jgi:Cu(I)/Ag(I) efflux system periplasmic protein CusF
MKTLKTLFLLTAMLAAAVHAQSTMTPGATPMSADAKKEVIAPAANMADGEVRKVDMDNKRITIKHGAIKNLDMPGMTMVFQVKDPAMLDKVKAGDKVRFKAENAGGTIVVTEIQPAR